MLSRNGILALAAAGTSLLLHVAVLSSFRAVRVGGGWGGEHRERFQDMAVVFVPPDVLEDPKDKPAEFPIGETGATGYASHKTDGDQTAIAREAPVDQAALSLDPVGTDPRPEFPSPDVAEGMTDGAVPLVSLPLPPAAPQNLTILTQPASPPHHPFPSAPRPPGAIATDPLPPSPPAPAGALVIVPMTPSPAMAPPVATSTQGGARAADPAPMSDSESDAFSVLGSARFVNGELRVRAGRKVRSRRPKIGLAGRFDAAYSRMEVTLRVAIDKTGKVTAVDVAKSSGSNEIDQPCRVSMYDWWFEPKIDASGAAVPDVFDFTIGFH